METTLACIFAACHNYIVRYQESEDKKHLPRNTCSLCLILIYKIWLALISPGYSKVNSEFTVFVLELFGESERQKLVKEVESDTVKAISVYQYDSYKLYNIVRFRFNCIHWKLEIQVALVSDF